MTHDAKMPPADPVASAASRAEQSVPVPCDRHLWGPVTAAERLAVVSAWTTSQLLASALQAGASEPVEAPPSLDIVKAPRPWLELVDGVVWPHGNRDYFGHIPEVWRLSRLDLLEVDEGHAKVALFLDGAVLLRDGMLHSSPALMTLLRRLRLAGIMLSTERWSPC